MEALSIRLSDEQEAKSRPLTRWLRDRARAVSGIHYHRALAELRLAARAEIEATRQYDAVLTPTLAQPPVPVGALRNDADPAADFEAQKRFTPFTSPYNMSGQPAVSLPLHWAGSGLPIGVQLVGQPADEATLLRLAAQLEAVAPWADRRPACWS
jgi:amidase